MPIYEYECQKCGSHFERRQAVSDDPLKICEKCGGPLEKKWSLSGFQFKGAGWYVTDYKGSKAQKGGEKAEKSGDGESTGSSDTASKSKTETPAASKDGGSASKD